MGGLRGIWNDGAVLATPDLQRQSDGAAQADDLALQVLVTPGTTQKKILPLSEETATVNPRVLLTPSGTAGAVQLNSCTLVAGVPSVPSGIALSGTLLAALSSPLIASNSSGANRYDLIYISVTRTVPTNFSSPPSFIAYLSPGPGVNTSASLNQPRKIKSVVDGSISTQATNVGDVLTATIAVNQGFLTGATPPTTAQINAALPADVATGYGSAYGTFYFAIGYVTVANGFTAGSAIAQSSITQTWNGGFIQPHRVKGVRPVSMYYGSAAEKPISPALTSGTQGAERFGSDQRFIIHWKSLATTGNTVPTGSVVDNSIDWRFRLVWGFMAYLGSASQLPLETHGTFIRSFGWGVGTSPNIQITDQAQIGPSWTGSGPAAIVTMGYNQTTATSASLAVISNGNLVVVRTGTVVDAVNGDLMVAVLYTTDQLIP
jgi:hypothetical protein